MRCRGLTLLVAAGLVGAATPTLAQPDFGIADPHWVPWTEFGGFFGPGGAARGEAALWAPLYQTPISLGFVEIRGKLFVADTQEANLAFGFRRMLPIGINVGMWAGYDLRHTAAGTLFHQLSGGVEVLGDRFAFRANGYLPLNNSAVIGTASTSTPALRLYNNNSAIGIFTDTVTATTRELALAGVDAEVGFGLPVAERNGRSHELWLHGGGFYFDHALLAGAVAGPKARAEWRVDNIFASMPGSRLSLETEFSYDAVRNVRWEAGLRLRIPLAPANDDRRMTRQQMRMAESLERDTDIVSTSVTTDTVTIDDTPEAVEDPLTGTRIDRVVFGDTPDELLAATALGGNTLIVAQGGNGPIDLTATEGLALVTDQVLQGGGSTIDLRGIDTGFIAGFTAPGSRPTLVSTASVNPDRGVVTVASRNHVIGLDIVGDEGCGCGFNEGIRGGSDLRTVVIEQNTITGVGDSAILFDHENADILIRDNRIRQVGNLGIGFGIRNSLVRIENNDISDVLGAGIYVFRGNRDVAITGNQVTSAAIGVGVEELNRDIVISNNTISDAGFGVLFADRNQGVEISGNRFDNLFVAILGIDNNHDFVIAGNHTTNAFAGFVFEDRNTNIAITGNTFADIDVGVIGFADRNRGLVIADNLITGTVLGDGLLIGRNNELTVSDNRFEAVFGDDVIDIDRNSNTLTGSGNAFTGTGNLCEVTGAQTGTIGFTTPAATCP